jgi:hypothetical protein
MPDPQPVNLSALSDLCTPWCVHVAATLRIADHIAAGSDRIELLAAAAGCDPYVLHRLLDHLVSQGLFLQPEPGRFALNDCARGLLDPASRLGLDLESLGGRMAGAWCTLLAFVRTGIPSYEKVFGLPFWEDLDAHPDIAASFDALIGPPGHGTPNPEFEITGGWEAIGSVVDVGGGTGAMLAEMLRAHPRLRGTLLDLPRTVARSGEILRPAGVADRATTVGQSFFDPLPCGADLYLLRGVLNDWPDAQAAAILRRCSEAARPNGRVVVLKSIGPDGAPRGLTIEMVLVGGRQRTLGEFQPLAEEAGLEILRAGKQASGDFVVECRPAPAA